MSITSVLGGARSVLGDVLERLLHTAHRSTPDEWHRIGWHADPTGYLPHQVCSWEHRFDDPEQEYRTVYCAEKALTCVRESLADLRPNATARADYAQWQLAQGTPVEQLHEPTRRVTLRWRRQHVLVTVEMVRDTALADIEDVELRENLERTHAPLLREHGMDHLNISEIRSKTRAVTQAVSRDLFENGAAGVLFRSNLDNERCAVLFEGRGHLEPSGEPLSLADDLVELEQVCREYGLLL